MPLFSIERGSLVIFLSAVFLEQTLLSRSHAAIDEAFMTRLGGA